MAASVSPDPADFPFLTFACEVRNAGWFDAGLRTQRRQRLPRTAVCSFPATWLFKRFPRTTAFCASIRCSSRHPALRVVSGAASSSVDAVWVFGPHPFAFLLIGLALVRRRRVVLGVRQDTIAYFRGRLPNARWAPALLPVRFWNAGFRGLARVLKTTVVGDELSRSYGGARSGLLPITVWLVGDADVLATPPIRDWTGRIVL